VVIGCGNITVPLLRPTIVFCAVTSLIGTVYMFDEPFVLTQGGREIHRRILASTCSTKVHRFPLRLRLRRCVFGGGGGVCDVIDAGEIGRNRYDEQVLELISF